VLSTSQSNASSKAVKGVEREREVKIMAMRQTNPAPAASIEAEDCAHGMPKMEEERRAAIHGYVERYDKIIIEFRTKCQQTGTEMSDHKRELNVNSMANLEQFWSDPKHSRLIDAKMVRFIVAYATEAALNGKMTFSFRLALFGIYLATWFKLGKDTFLAALRGGLPLETSN
jgi:hypothetical protein